jgi:hypothetical protein
MIFLSLLLAFGLLAVLHGLLDLSFKLCAFCCQWTHQGGDWENKWSVPWFACDESLTWRGLNWNPGRFNCFTLSFVHLENHVYLFRGVQVAGTAWRAAMRIVEGLGDLVQRTGDGHIGWVLGGRAIERSGGTVCGLHRTRGDKEREFFGWAPKPRSTVSWLSLKTKVMEGFPV